MSNRPKNSKLHLSQINTRLFFKNKIVENDSDIPSHFSCLHINIQSLRQKLNQLDLLLNDASVHLLCLNEHWLNINEVELYVPVNYKLISYYCRPNSNYGGVSIFMRRDLSIKCTALDLSPFCVM